LTPKEVRKISKSEFEKNHPIPQRVEAFKQICVRFQPVMRYFFFEKFSASDWLTARNEFTKSVAVTSMLGYLVGLGDRHLQNILIDCITGEVVHIDLNMIFEGGRTLRVPERVPFRMTRDMVDGLGPWGTTQGFQRQAAITLGALRLNVSGLLTVLSIFKQHSPIGGERALSRVNDRLKGVAEGGEALSEMAQVVILEREATKVENLALMYPGWAPGM
jgi:phosphatidylinositol kinase/protein kinase (PI-3  family)